MFTSRRLRDRIQDVRNQLADIGGQDTVDAANCIDEYLSVPL